VSEQRFFANREGAVTNKQAPWPFYTQGHAARLLGGVSVEWLMGLANNPIPAVRAVGRTGKRVFLYQKQAIDELVIKMPTRQRGSAAPVSQTDSE